MRSTSTIVSMCSITATRFSFGAAMMICRPSFFVEAHHLALVLAVHLGERLVEYRKRHAGGLAGAALELP